MLTGERRVLRADVMLDAGNSLSPAIDAGQVPLAISSSCLFGQYEDRPMCKDSEDMYTRIHVHTYGQAPPVLIYDCSTPRCTSSCKRV